MRRVLLTAAVSAGFLLVPATAPAQLARVPLFLTTTGLLVISIVTWRQETILPEA